VSITHDKRIEYAFIKFHTAALVKRYLPIIYSGIMVHSYCARKRMLNVSITHDKLTESACIIQVEDMVHAHPTERRTKTTKDEGDWHQ